MCDSSWSQDKDIVILVIDAKAPFRFAILSGGDGNTGEMAKSVEEAAQRITELKVQTPAYRNFCIVKRDAQWFVSSSRAESTVNEFWEIEGVHLRWLFLIAAQGLAPRNQLRKERK